MVDRLKQMGYQVREVQSGESADDGEHYANKRVEMWGEMRDWLTIGCIDDDVRQRLAAAHVAVVGIGGVGSWVAEALARSGVGELSLFDLDDVCISNSNRQLHALAGAIGRPKVEVMAERIRAINPDCVVHAVADFVSRDNMAACITSSRTSASSGRAWVAARGRGNCCRRCCRARSLASLWCWMPMR